MLCGLLVVANPFSRNPVTSAMFLVLTIVSLAGLFVLLHAFFLAAVQMLVYAGAVMVLFLFVIMLLDLKAEERRKIKVFGLVLGVVIGRGCTLLRVLFSTSAAKPARRGRDRSARRRNNAAWAKLLFTDYLLPFEIVSVLLLVAMVGVILLSKKDLKMMMSASNIICRQRAAVLPRAAGRIVRRNLLVIYMSLELMLNAANLALVAFSRFNNNLNGQVMVFFIITVAAAEVAVGLALIVALYRKRQTAHVEDLTTMKLLTDE